VHVLITKYPTPVYPEPQLTVAWETKARERGKMNRWNTVLNVRITRLSTQTA